MQSLFAAMEYHDLLEVDEPEPPPTLTPLEESEARAASLKTEMHIARNKVNALNAELRSEKAVSDLLISSTRWIFYGTERS